MDGHVDREAADLMEEEESSEEAATLFAILPFASEESDEEKEESQKGEGPRESDEGLVMELSQIGPPTKKLKAPIVTIGMPYLH